MGTGFKYSLVSKVPGDGAGTFLLHAGVHHLKGRRPSQEDRDITLPDLFKVLEKAAKAGAGSDPILLAPGAALYAVLDGHGGEEASEFCSTDLPKTLVTELLKRNGKVSGVRQALWNAFTSTDQNFLSQVVHMLRVLALHPHPHPQPIRCTTTLASDLSRTVITDLFCTPYSRSAYIHAVFPTCLTIVSCETWLLG